jgi:hypothetical protein
MSHAEESPPESAQSDGHHGRLVRWFLPRPLPQPLNPALLKHSEERAQDAQNRVADKITAFAGSMTFVYIHVVWFGLWIGLGVENYPFGLLTMIVSLEAIFLSTFVMISQNRADAKRQVIADQQWRTVQTEDQQNQELLDLSKQILKLTRQVDSRLASDERPESDSSGTVGTPRRTGRPSPHLNGAPSKHAKRAGVSGLRHPRLPAHHGLETTISLVTPRTPYRLATSS